MVHSGILPKSYFPLHRKYSTQGTEIGKRSQVLPKRRFSGDRIVQRQPREFTMQAARQIIKARNECYADACYEIDNISRLPAWPDLKTKVMQEGKTAPSPDTHLNSAKSVSLDGTFEEASIIQFREWNMDNEDDILKIRPGRDVFPLIRKAVAKGNRLRILQDRRAEDSEPLTLGKGSDVWRINDKRRSFLQVETQVVQREISDFNVYEMLTRNDAAAQM